MTYRFFPIVPPNEPQPMETTVTKPIIKKNKTSKLLHNYNNICQKIKQLTDDFGFDCKSSTKGLKFQTYSSDSYRSVVAYLKKNNVSFHSFQPKEEKVYRVIIRNMQHSTDTSFIKQELLNKGFVTRNIMSVTNKITNSPFRSSFLK